MNCNITNNQRKNNLLCRSMDCELCKKQRQVNQGELWKCPICSDYFKNKKEHIAFEVKDLRKSLAFLKEL